MTDSRLNMIAKHLDDIEGLRKATSNRLYFLTNTEPDSDGVLRTLGMGDNDPVVRFVTETLAALDAQESETVKVLQKLMKEHPLGPWCKAQKGVGEKQLARLIAVIGDPYWIDEAEFEDDEGNVTHRSARARTVSELWAYAGLHVIGGESARRRKGVQSNWKTEIKTRAYLISEACVKAGVRKDPEDETKRVGISEYGKVYLARRARTAETHPDWTPGHSHNDALRIVSKEVLKGLWIESKRIREGN